MNFEILERRPPLAQRASRLGLGDTPGTSYSALTCLPVRTSSRLAVAEWLAPHLHVAGSSAHEWLVASKPGSWCPKGTQLPVFPRLPLPVPGPQSAPRSAPPGCARPVLTREPWLVE